MAGTVNKVILVGHTGDDVKMKYFEGGNCIGRFPLATSEDYINKATNERVSSTEWHNCVVRNKAAEVCEKYLKKGDKVYIEGRIKSRQWNAEDGQVRYTTEIQVQEFTFLSPKNEHGTIGAQPAVPQQAAQPSYETPATQATSGDDEDDLPF
jgi:single-strand DNA-binding protein